MPRLHLSAVPGARCAALIALLAACAAVAQPLIPPKTTLYLVLRTGPDVTADEVLTKLKKGLRASASETDGPPTIKSVSPSFVEELQSLSEGSVDAPLDVAKGKVAIRRLPTTADTAYELQVAPEQSITKLRVTYKKAKPKDYVPGKAGTTGLVLIVPGRYAFYPDSAEPDDAPVSYDGEVNEFGKPETPVKGDWAKGDKYYVVTMRDFRGNRDRLFQAIQDKKVVPNPFKGVTLGNSLEFAFAKLQASRTSAGRRKIDKDNNITVRIDSLENDEPARVWIYFPLDEKGKAEKLDDLRKKSGAALSEEIRKTKPVMAPVMAKDNALVSSKDGPKWYEIPARPTPSGIPPADFERKLQLADLPGLMEKYPKAWMLVVWEFDNGKDPPEAILIDVADGRFPLDEQDMPGWDQELRDAIKRSQPTPAPKP